MRRVLVLNKSAASLTGRLTPPRHPRAAARGRRDKHTPHVNIPTESMENTERGGRGVAAEPLDDCLAHSAAQVSDFMPYPFCRVYVPVRLFAPSPRRYAYKNPRLPPRIYLLHCFRIIQCPVFFEPTRSIFPLSRNIRRFFFIPLSLIIIYAIISEVVASGFISI